MKTTLDTTADTAARRAGLLPAATASTATRLAASSITPATQRAYTGAMLRLGEHLDGAPLNDKTLAGYLAVLFDRGRSPATATMTVAAVRFVARITGRDSPVGPATAA